MYYGPQRTVPVPMDSRWTPILGFPNYWISDHGQVFNMKRGQLVTAWRNNHGIICVRMYDSIAPDSRGTTRSLKKLMERYWKGMELASEGY